GNVTFQAPPSRFISAAIPANNFGVQAIAQLGALELRGIYAQQKGNVVRDRVYAVGETTTQPIDRVARDLDYEAGRFFFAVDPALVPRYPAVDVLSIDRSTMPDSLRVGSVRVYRVRAASPTSTTNQNIGGARVPLRHPQRLRGGRQRGRPHHRGARAHGQPAGAYHPGCPDLPRPARLGAGVRPDPVRPVQPAVPAHPRSPAGRAAARLLR